MVHPTMSQTAPPAWDLPSIRYEWAQKRNKSQRIRTSIEHTPTDDIPSNDVCTRLFQDYYTRLKSQKLRAEELLRAAKAKAATTKPRTLLNPAVIAEKQRLKHLQIQHEHEELSQALKQQRELDAERNAYLKLNSTRLYPPFKHHDARLEPILRTLRELGDSKRNAVCINTLLSSQSEDTLKRFVDRVIELRDAQTQIIKQISDCNAYDRFIEKQMTKEVLEDVMATIAKRLDSDQKTILQTDNSNKDGLIYLPKQKWMKDESQRDSLINLSLNDLKNVDYFEDLTVQRRQLASEKNNLMLSLLQFLTRCDINMRRMLAEYRLGKFHIRKYDPSAIENVKQQDWFRDLGSTTSLRNNMKIRRSVRNVVEEVKKILKLESPIPDLENDPDRKLLEQVFSNNQLNFEDEEMEPSQNDESSSSSSA